MSVSVLKQIKNNLIIPLTRLFNFCISEGIYPVYPDAFKVSRVIPVFKKGDPRDVNNYRPISVSKIFELLLKDQLINYMEQHNLLNDFQYGFRRGRSTALAVMGLLEYVVGVFEEGMHVGATLCDLSKAFDCISHDVLLAKLVYYGLDNTSIALMRSYLDGRRQCTYFGRAFSEEGTIQHGVPQGSVLGPLLFIIYINDIGQCTDSKLVLFADDTTCLCKDKKEADLKVSMERVVADLSRWFAANKLSLNINKTEKIIFSLRDIVSLNETEKVRFLGLHMDPALIFDEHVNSVCSKLTKYIFLLKNLKRTVDKSVVLMVFHALIQSTCNYALLAWGHAPRAQRVFGLQRRALRIVEGLSFRADVKPAFKNLKLLTLPSRYIYECLTHVKKNINSYNSRSDIHQYKTRQTHDLNINMLRLRRSQIASLYYGPLFFNKLPKDIRILTERDFSGAVRGLLCEGAFYSVQEFLEGNFGK